MAKCKYDPETFPKIAKALSEKGCTQKEIYTALGIGKNAFHTYIHKYKDFKDAIYCPLDVENVIKKTEAALFKSALGYTAEETKMIERKSEVTGELEVFEITTTTKHIAANVKAQEIILTNKSENWRKNPDNIENNKHTEELIKALSDGKIVFNSNPEDE